MNDIKSAFGGIHAEPQLKSRTIARICSPPRRALRPARIAAALCALALAASGFLYFTPAVFLDVDINPSLELGVNAFGRVISAQSYNEDGQKVLETLPVMHKSYGAALLALMEIADGDGLLGEIVAVTLQSDSEKRANALALAVEQEISGYISSHHSAAGTEVFTVSREIRDAAHALGISPARYLAILELIDAGLGVSVESCKGHSLGTLYQIAENHGKGHRHGQENQTSPSTNGHHSNNHH